MTDILQRLSAPFRPEEIDWRIGPTTADKSRGMALGYIDARTVMARLDAVCGPLWQCEYVPMPNGSCCCRIGVKIGESEWIWRSNGAFTMPDSDKVDAKEMAEKGSYSDAFKRAAVLWGIGQYLYDIQSPWVAIEKKGNSYVIAESEIPKLHKLLSGGPMVQMPSARPASPREGARQITPQEWVNASKSTIDTFRTERELEMWEQKAANKAKLEWLATAEVELFEDMEAFIGIKRKTLTAVPANV